MPEPIATCTYPIEQLRAFAERIFQHCEVPEAEARQAADVLAAADLRGIDSHGIARLRAYYGMLTHGRITPMVLFWMYSHVYGTNLSGLLKPAFCGEGDGNPF